jgi:hypothetical protein
MTRNASKTTWQRFYVKVWDEMSEAPSTIRVSYEEIGSNGIVCAYSHDLKGFRIHGKSYDELHRRAPIVATELARELYAADCSYHWRDGGVGVLAKERAFAELTCL